MKSFVIYLMSTIVVAQICCSPLVSLWISYLYSKQTSSRMLKFHPLSKNCCSFSSLHCEKKTQINPTTYCTYGSKKKRTHPDHLLYLWQHQKMYSYWIPFIVDVINDCHNNSRVVKGRQQDFFLIAKVFMAT